MLDTRPLRIAPFRRLWLAGVVTAIGGQFSFIAVPKQLYDLTGSSRFIGVAGAVSFACLAVAALWGGALADTKDRRSVLIVSNCGTAATAVAFWATYDQASVPVMLTLIGVQAAFFGATMSAMGAAIPRLVPTELLAASASLGSIVRNFGPIIGPLLAGLLMPLVGLKWLYLIDAIALTATVFAVYRLPQIPPLPSARPVAPGRVWAGIRYLGTQPVLVAVLAADLAATVFGFPIALYPEMAGPDGYLRLGLLYAAIPVGVVVMGLFSGRMTRATNHGAMLAIGVIAWGATLIGFGSTGAAVFLVAGGAALFVLSTFRNAITQAAARDDMRGRTQGALTLILTGGPALGNFAHGFASDAIGPRWTIAGGGVLVIVTVSILAQKFWNYRPPD
jgi:MFS family permease